MDSSTDIMALAHESLSMGRWSDARRDFEQALSESESPEAMEGLGAAAWWQEDVPTVLRARERAYRLYRSLDDRVGAGRMATELGFDCAVFRLEMAVSNGWRQRAHRLLDDLDPLAEQVWLAFREAERGHPVVDRGQRLRGLRERHPRRLQVWTGRPRRRQRTAEGMRTPDLLIANGPRVTFRADLSEGKDSCRKGQHANTHRYDARRDASHARPTTAC